MKNHRFEEFCRDGMNSGKYAEPTEGLKIDYNYAPQGCKFYR